MNTVLERVLTNSALFYYRRLLLIWGDNMGAIVLAISSPL